MLICEHGHLLSMAIGTGSTFIGERELRVNLMKIRLSRISLTAAGFAIIVKNACYLPASDTVSRNILVENFSSSCG